MSNAFLKSPHCTNFGSVGDHFLLIISPHYLSPFPILGGPLKTTALENMAAVLCALGSHPKFAYPIIGKLHGILAECPLQPDPYESQTVSVRMSRFGNILFAGSMTVSEPVAVILVAETCLK